MIELLINLVQKKIVAKIKSWVSGQLALPFFLLFANFFSHYSGLQLRSVTSTWKISIPSSASIGK
jgi:GTP cyclohydrolase III